MNSELLDSRATPERLRALRDAGVLSPSATRAAFEVALGSPSASAWATFIKATLLSSGVLLVLSGVVFFFAANWAELGRFGKLALLQAALVGAVAGAWRLWPRASGQACLTVAAGLVGPLLAVYGQAYQTGADAWELFAGWAALILPWVLLSRSQPLWLLLLALVNVGLTLYWEQVGEGAFFEDGWPFPLLALLDASAWLVVETLSRRGVAWLKGRWLPRVLMLAAASWAAPLALLTVAAPGEATTASVTSLVVAVGLVIGPLSTLRGKRLELFLLAASVALAVALVTALIGRWVFARNEWGLWDGGSSPAGFLVVAVALVAQLTLAARWLRAQARKRPGEDA
ncbi:MAG: DUF2157 domain-containing protein [Myxococcaceae bacterium]|nr:DUF2157 domain-containing protein [Myxococcaceae bacterium]MCI0670989.1 DUF2157 domain-containing protein [Myxococcaceae bacterium]